MRELIQSVKAEGDSVGGMIECMITGNSGLATGGSGDVLAGTVASLVSRGINETVASAMAVYIHGLAGDIAKDKYGIESVIASKVMECIPCALRQILQVEN